MRSFVKIKPSRIGDIFLSFTDIGKSCPVRDFFTSQMCLLTLYAKIKFSRKFPNLQYMDSNLTSQHSRTKRRYKVAWTSKRSCLFLHSSQTQVFDGPVG